jgi:hypothetical protein
MAKISSATWEFDHDTPYVNLQRFGEDMEYLIKLLRDNRLPKENLYITYIDYDDIFLNDMQYLYKTTERFFKTDINSKYVRDVNHDCQFYFSKSCWLVSELIKDGMFRSYVTAHYNPRMKKIIIHPGSHRYKILHLFNNRKQPFIFWNTNEVQYDWMDDSQIVNLDINDDLFKKYDFTIRPDHGSLIPHFTLRKDGPMDDSAEDYYPHIQYIIKNLKIKLNIKKLDLKLKRGFGSDILSRFINKDHNCEITIKKHTKDSIQKAILIMCTGLSYEDDDLKIESNIL